MPEVSAKGYPSELRRFLNEEFALMPGASPSRPAPAHILNRFVFSLLGEGIARKALVEALYASPNQLDTLFADKPRTELRDDLRLTLRATLDADRRGFGVGFASYLPIHAGVVGPDASDDHFGQGLVLMMTPEQRRTLRDRFVELLNPVAGDGDPVSRFLAVVAAGLAQGKPADQSDLVMLSQPATKASGLGDSLFEMLDRRINQVLMGNAGADRIRLLLRMSDFLAGFVCLALLYEGALRELTDRDQKMARRLLQTDGIGAVLGIPVYGGTPPGPPQDMSVQLSRLCLLDAVKRSHRGMAQAFAASMPKSTSALEKQVTDRFAGRAAQDILSALRVTGAIKSPAVAFSALLSEAQLHQSVKLLGTKVGLVAPRRGAGASRLVLETTFIDALAYFVGEDGMPFEAFVDACYRRLGLLIGFPDSISSAVYARLETIAGQSIDVTPVLLASAEHCRRRLINCGLAQEFSDHATVLRLS